MAEQRLLIDIGADVTNLRSAMEDAEDLTQNYHEFARNQAEISSKHEKEMLGKNEKQMRSVKDKGLKDLKKEYEKRKRLASGNAKELERIEKDYQSGRKKLENKTNEMIGRAREKATKDYNKRIEHLSGKHARRVRAERIKQLKNQYREELRLAEGNAEEINRIRGRRRAELGEARQAGRPAGGMGGKLKGMIGIGAGVAALTGLVSMFGKADKAGQEFSDAQARVNTLLDDLDAKQTPAAFEKMRATSKETGKSITELGDALYFTISAVPDLAKNLDAATSVVEKASKAAVALNASTEEMILSMTAAGNAAGLNVADLETQNFLFDTMSNTMKQGVMSGQQLSANFAKSIPIMSALTENTRDGITATSAMSAALTGSGVKMEEAQTQIRGMANEFLKSGNATKFMEAGLQGIDKETKKVTDWGALFQSASKDVDKFAGMMGSIEAANALRILGKEVTDVSGNVVSKYEQMAASFEGIGGTSEEMWLKMSNTGEVQSKRLSATWNDALITISQAWSDGTGAISAFQGAAAGAIDWVMNFFQTTEQKFAGFMSTADEMLGQSAKFSDVGRDIAQTLSMEDISTENVEAQFNSIKNLLPEIAKISVVTASEINDILSNPNEVTAEGLAKISEILEQVTGQADALATISLKNAADTAKKQLADAFDESFGWWEKNGTGIATTISGAFGSLFGPLGTIVGVEFGEQFAKATGGSIEWESVFEKNKDAISGLEEKLAGLRAEAKGMTIGSEEWNENLEQTSDVFTELTEKQASFGKLNDGIKTATLSQLKVMESMAVQSGEQFDMESAIGMLMQGMPEDFRKIAGLREEIIKYAGDELEISQKRGNVQFLINEGKENELAGMLNIDELEKGGLKDQVEKAGLMKNILVLKIEEVQATIDQAEMAGDLSEEELQTLKSTENRLQALYASLEVAKEIKAEKEVETIATKELNELINLRINQELEGNDKTLAGRKLILAELIKELNARILILESQTGLSEKDALELANKKKTVVLMMDQSKEIDDQLAKREMFGIVEKDITKEKKKQKDVYKSVEEKQQAMLGLKQQELDLLLAQGGINPTEHQERSLEILQQRLLIEEAILQKMIEQGTASEKQIMAQQGKVLSAKKAIAGSQQKKQQAFQKKADNRAKEQEKRASDQKDKAIKAAKEREEKRKRNAEIVFSNQLSEAETRQNIAHIREKAEFSIIKKLHEVRTQMKQKFDDFINTSGQKLRDFADSLKTPGQKIADSFDKTSQKLGEFSKEMDKRRLELGVAGKEVITNYKQTMGKLMLEVGNTVFKSLGDPRTSNMVGKEIRAESEQMKKANLLAGRDAVLYFKDVQALIKSASEKTAKAYKDLGKGVMGIADFNSLLDKANSDYASHQDASVGLFEEFNLILKSQGKQTIKSYEDFQKRFESEIMATLKEKIVIPKFDEMEPIQKANELSDAFLNMQGAYKTIIDLQTQASEATNPEEIQALLTQADNLYTSINRDLAAAGITIEQLSGQFLDLTNDKELKALLSGDILPQKYKDLLNKILPQAVMLAHTTKDTLETQREQNEVLLTQEQRMIEIAKNSGDINKIQNVITELTKKEEKRSEQAINDRFADYKADLFVQQARLEKYHKAEEALLDKNEKRKKNVIIKLAKLEANIEIELANLRRMLEEGADQTAIDEQRQKISQINQGIGDLTKAEADLTKENLVLSKAVDDNTDKLKKNKDAIEGVGGAAKKDVGKFLKEQFDMVKGAITETTDSFDDFAGSIPGRIGGFARAFKLIESGAEGSQEAIITVIKGISTMAESMSNAVFSAMDSVKEIQSLTGGDKVEAITEMTGDISKKVGMALLESGVPPLAVIGGILLIAGTITKIVGKVINAVKGVERTSIQLAEEKQAKNALITKEYELQLELMDLMVQRGDVSLDQAKERLAFLKQQKDEMIAQGNEWVQMTEGELDTAKASKELKVTEIQTQLDVAETHGDIEEMNKDQLQDLAAAMGVARKWSDGSWKTKKQLREGINDKLGRMGAEKIDLETDITNIVSAKEIVSGEVREGKGVIEELKNQLQFKIDRLLESGTDPAAIKKAMQNIVDLVRGDFETLLGEAGIEIPTNLAGMTQEELSAYLASLSDNLQFSEQIGEAGLDLLNTLGKQETTQASITEIMQKQNDLSMKKLEIQQAFSDKQLSVGNISEITYNKQTLSILTKKLDLQKQTSALLMNDFSNQAGYLDSVAAVWALEQEIFVVNAKVEQDKLDDRRQESSHDKTRLNHLKKMGELTDEQYTTEYMDNLEKQLEFEKSVLATLETQANKEDEIITQKELLMSIEEEIHGLLEDENALEDAKLEKLRELNRERTKMLFAGEADPVALKDLENQIIAEMTTQGATQEAIDAAKQTFQASYPQFEQGGRTKEGLAMMHDNESVLNKPATSFLDKAAPGFIDSMNTFPGNAVLENLANSLTSSQRDLELVKNTNNYNTISVGNIVLENVQTDDPSRLGEEIRIAIEREFQGKGVQVTQL